VYLAQQAVVKKFKKLKILLPFSVGFHAKMKISNHFLFGLRVKNIHLAHDGGWVKCSLRTT